MQPISACTSVYDTPKGFLLSPCNQSQPGPVFMLHLRDFCSLHATNLCLYQCLWCTWGISALSMQTISACNSVYVAPNWFLLSPCNQSLPVPVFMVYLRDFCSLHATNLSLYQCLWCTWGISALSMQPISACTSVYDAPKGFLLSPCNQSQPEPVFMLHLRDFCSLHATNLTLYQCLWCT